MHGMWNDEPRRRQHGGRRGPGGRGNDMGLGAWGGPAGPMGPPPWLMQMFGPEMGGRRGRHGGGRPRVRRGDVRSAILDVLAGADEPVNGYQVIQQIAERSDGAWRPSPGSVYPTIQQLQDEGLVDQHASAAGWFAAAHQLWWFLVQPRLLAPLPPDEAGKVLA